MTKHSLEEILVEGSSYASGSLLKKRLISEKGWEDRCMNPTCPSPSSEWDGKPLVLHLDHINGDHSDNRIENLRILCPNCHSQTLTYCGKKNTPFQYKKKRDPSTIDALTVARIKELVPLAKYARRQHQEDDPKVQASKELNKILSDLYDDGYTYDALSKVCEIKVHSVRARILKTR